MEARDREERSGVGILEKAGTVRDDGYCWLKMCGSWKSKIG